MSEQQASELSQHRYFEDVFAVLKQFFNQQKTALRK